MAEEFKKKYSLIKVEGSLVGSINSLLSDLLSKTDLEGIIIPKKLPVGDGFFPALVTDPAELATANPLAPIMPVNMSRSVSDFTRLAPTQKKVAVVGKPCEIRALVELEKLKQANSESLIIIGIDCPGTVPVQALDELSGSEELLSTFKDLKEHKLLRTACQTCEHFTPGVADIVIGLYGSKLDLKKQFLLGVTSTAGQQLIEPLKLKFDDKDKAAAQNKKRIETINKLQESRSAKAQEMMKDTGERISGLDNFMKELSSCINCHNCMTVCPICYCQECFFESPTFNLEPDKYLKHAQLKGATRLPGNVFLFHVTRFNHMVLSCVACGMCEQGCPANIPLLSIYKTVGSSAQKVFDYEPGRSLDEEIPILTFQEEELEPR